MNSLKINFVLPSFSTKPGGGVKIMYEYANRMALKGHKVQILYSVVKPFRKTKSPILFKYLKAKLSLSFYKSWFPLSKSIKRKIILDLTDKHTPDADVTISTWWEMSYRLDKLDNSKGIKINLIQDFENWKGFEEKVIESYRLNLNHFVISKYLERKVNNYSPKKSILLPNAIDIDQFNITNEIKLRSKTIIMLFSGEERKGSKFGLAALEIVKSKVPELKVILFSVLDNPLNLPNYVSFFKTPKNLSYLFNQASIFISPSLAEGWALPPAEAMACGCAVICTNIGGHVDYALNHQTAITVKTKDVDELANAIINLLNDSALRLRIAEEGYKNITTNFSWNKSVELLEMKVFNLINQAIQNN